MGDTGAWRQTEMGAVGIGGDGEGKGGQVVGNGSTGGTRMRDEVRSTELVGTGGHISIKKKKANKQKCKFRE